MRAEAVLDSARDAGVTIATAESCTGGMIAARLTDIPGSSDVLDRGYITYSNRAKTEMLGVTPATLETFGAVSEPVAREMADGALRSAGVTMAIAVTGIAGPGGSEQKPEGRVCFGLAMAGQKTWTETVDYGAIGRAKVRAATVQHALAMLGRALGSAQPDP